MKWYEIILESIMQPDEALKILGITSFSSKAELDKIYKQLAIKNHPDRGGDPEKMKQINIAKDVLSKYSSYGSTGGKWTSKAFPLVYRNNQEKIDEELEISKKFAVDYLSKINTKIYTDYLNNIFNDNFSVNSKIEKPYGFSSWVYLFLEFTDSERNKVIKLNISIDTYDVRNALFGEKKVISANDASFNITMSSSLFIDGKSQVLTKSHSVKANSINWSDTPSVLLPKARLEKIASGKVRSNSKVAKRDFDSLFKLKYKAKTPFETSTDYMIPNSNNSEIYLEINRNTFMRAGYYSVESVREHKGYSYNAIAKSPSVILFPENKEVLEYFDKMIKKFTVMSDFSESSIKNFLKTVESESKKMTSE